MPIYVFTIFLEFKVIAWIIVFLKFVNAFVFWRVGFDAYVGSENNCKDPVQWCVRLWPSSVAPTSASPRW